MSTQREMDRLNEQIQQRMDRMNNLQYQLTESIAKEEYAIAAMRADELSRVLVNINYKLNLLADLDS